MPALFFLGGVLILGGLLLLGYLFVNTDPVRLARLAKWLGLGLAGALALGLVILTEGRILGWLVPLAALWPLARRLRAMIGGVAGPAAGRSSTAETPFVRMSLDHDTGAMTGTVLRGRFAGLRLDELGREELVALLRECRADDEEGARLIEAYLDRAHPDWRDGPHDEGAGAGAPPRAASSDMTAEEAYAILGLAPGSDTAAIRAAHHRLMKQLHPDHGGTDYFAAQLNRARDVLLRQKH